MDKDFWDCGNRVIALASGGSFLGGLLGGIPLAIAGAIVAGVYAWKTYESGDS